VSAMPWLCQHPTTLGMIFTAKAAQASGGLRSLLPIQSPCAPFPFTQ